jgi:RNA polymerase sigma factor (sigma-70 family)
MAVSLAKSNKRVHDDIDDCYEASFFALIRAARSYDRNIAMFSTYAHRGIRIGLNDHHRSADRWMRKRRIVADATTIDCAAKDDEPRDDMLSGTVANALSKLPDREREIVKMRLIDGLKLHEVGEKFGLTKERVRQIQEAAMKKLRELLAEYEGSLN